MESLISFLKTSLFFTKTLKFIPSQLIPPKPILSYLNAIQTTCPHVLRYLAIAVITNTNNRRHVEDLVRVLQQEQTTYQDPLTEFIQSLLVQFDFEGAQSKLKECELV